MEEECLQFDQYNIVAHELESAYGGQTACESPVDKINYRKTNWVALHFPTLNTDSMFEM